ncbi:hypothetical protein, partial [Escherichia coli]|uniref:hypothetical protein n=1 Tax=Escherichia coli TaxID=562 RepID=UPI001BC843B2
TSIICSPMTSLKTSIKTITYLSDIGYLEIQGASLEPILKNSNLFTLDNAAFRCNNLCRDGTPWLVS